jgi:hypothetical protein
MLCLARIERMHISSGFTVSFGHAQTLSFDEIDFEVDHILIMRAIHLQNEQVI